MISTGRATPYRIRLSRQDAAPTDADLMWEWLPATNDGRIWMSCLVVSQK
jgi:hypothetical protein